MFRVYCFIDPAQKYRYYRCKSGMWSQWSHAAQPLTLSQARQVAQTDNALFERIGG